MWVQQAALRIQDPRTVSMAEPGHEDKGPGRHHHSGRTARLVLANSCLLLVGVGGGALLAWWALAFHQSNEQLWMVPVGLVLVGTPVFAWLSLFASGVCRRLQRLCTAAAAPPPPSSDPER